MSIKDRYISGSGSQQNPLAVYGAQVINIDQLRLAAENKLRTVEAEELRRIEVEKTKADRWNGQLPQNVYAGAPIPFLNVSKQ